MASPEPGATESASSLSRLCEPRLTAYKRIDPTAADCPAITVTDIPAHPTIDRISAGATDQHFASAATTQIIVAAAADDTVATTLASNSIRAGAAQNQRVAAAAIERATAHNNARQIQRGAFRRLQ